VSFRRPSYEGKSLMLHNSLRNKHHNSFSNGSATKDLRFKEIKMQRRAMRTMVEALHSHAYDRRTQVLENDFR